MNTTPTTEHHRTVTANITLSLDGRICGAAGPYDMGWIVPHAITNEAHQHITTVTANVSTIVLGRINYEGFSGYWPTVADNPDADPWDRDFSRWLTNTDKTVFSTTLTKTAWANTTIETRPPATVVTELLNQPGGDIIVLASSTIIRDLINHDLIDQLSIVLAPHVVGAGPQLFDDTVTTETAWDLTSHTATATGALCLTYARTL
jgi:dihydrofolate reductase